MAVTADEILGRGKGPLQTTWADQATQASSAPVVSSPPSGASAGGDESTGVENVSCPQTVTDREQVIPVDGRQTAPGGKKLSYVELFQQMSPYKPPTPEELERERKKQKREAVFAAIGEGISAMSNLYFTTQYAPDAFDPSKGMAATTKARFDRLKKEREDNQRQYMEGFMRAMRLDAEDARDERNWNHTIERERVSDRYKEAADARAQAKADRDAAMAQLRMDLMQGRVNQQEAAAEAKRIEADYAEAYWQSRINKNNYRRPIGSGSRGGGATKKYPVFDENGDVVDHVYTKEEAVSETERNGGTYPGQQREQQQEQQQGRRKKETKSILTMTTPKAGREPRKSKMPNPMGDGGTSNGGGKQKKKNPMS